MKKALKEDLKRIEGRAYHYSDWAAEVLERYHDLPPGLDDAARLRARRLYEWLFVPLTLWPFNVVDVLKACLTTLKQGKKLTRRQCLMIDLMPEAPGEEVCLAVAEHECHVQQGQYENLLNAQVKFRQNEDAVKTNPEFQKQWERFKKEFPVQKHCDHKGVLRRTMGTERNLRPGFSVDLRRADDVFRAAFDTFCLRWNLYGMQKDEPLLLKLAVNLTPYGTMIHIPSYWSFDPKRDIRWDAIAKLHRVRVEGRQGPTLAENRAERMTLALKLPKLDAEAKRLQLKGDAKHAFLCKGLGWVPETSARRISRLRELLKK